MKFSILQKILATQKETETFRFLTEKLSGAEFNSLLMEVFKCRAKQISPSELLKNYDQNRFVRPTDIEPLDFAEFEMKILKFIQKSGFQVLKLSPVSPLGSCSVLAQVDQKNILSADRKTEVNSDATNILALEIASRKKKNPKIGKQNLAASHRHLRTQSINIEGFTPHFQIAALASSGVDTGNYQFEIETLGQHISTYKNLLVQVLKISEEDLKVDLTIFSDGNFDYLEKAALAILETSGFEKFELKKLQQSGNDYYRNFRYKILLQKGENRIEFIDGGTVDWTQKLLQNRKERLVTSGLGVEFLYRILNS